MPAPPVTIYVTTLTSAPLVRKRIQLLRNSLRGLEIPYEEFDLANDEEAKRRWQRAKPEGMVVGLPGFLVGGEWVGTMDEFEEAVETQELENFLKQDMELADVSQTIGEAELDRLMREMTEEDLDDLVSNMDLNKDVEVLTEPTPTPAASATESTAHKRKSSISEQLFAGVSGLVASAASAVSSTVHKAEDALKHAAEEPASVTAKRAHAAPGSPVATTKVMTLDDMIDATLAKEAVEEDAREAEAKNHKAEAAADIKRKVDALHERVVADKEKVEEKVEEKVASKEAEVKAEAKAGADAEAKPAATAAAAETE